MICFRFNRLVQDPTLWTIVNLHKVSCRLNISGLLDVLSRATHVTEFSTCLSYHWKEATDLAMVVLDTAWRHLRSLDVSLPLEDLEASKAILVKVGACRNLKKLSLRGTYAGGDVLKSHAVFLRNITHLTIKWLNGLNDTNMTALANAGLKLKALRIEDGITGVSSSTMAYLVDKLSESLEILCVCGAHLRMDFYESLTRCKKLWSLSVILVDSRFIAPLGQVGSLRKLHLNGYTVQPNLIKIFTTKKLKHLRTLHLFFPLDTTISDLKVIAACCHDLTYMKIGLNLSKDESWDDVLEVLNDKWPRLRWNR